MKDFHKNMVVLSFRKFGVGWVKANPGIATTIKN
jgi:hypothetical protein